MLSDLAFGLAAAERQDREVVVITSRLGYDGNTPSFPALEHASDVRILRVWTSRFGRARLLGRIVDYLTFYVFAAWTLAREARCGDVVVIKTDPPMLALMAQPVARLKRARVVNWLQDIYPEVAESLGLLRGPLRPVTRLLRRARNACLRQADANVVVGRGMAERVRAMAPAHGRIVEISNWADGALIRPISHADNTLRVEWGLGDAFTVAYSGNLGRAHDLSALLEAMSALARTPGPRPVAWLFIGGGAQFEILRNEVAKRRITGVRFAPYQPPARLAESLSAADVHLISLQPALEGLIVPSKLYGILAAGRPALFVGDPAGEVARVLAEAECGATVIDGAQLAQHVCAWSVDGERVARMGHNARAVFERSYDKPLALARWNHLLATLTPKARRLPGQLRRRGGTSSVGSNGGVVSPPSSSSSSGMA